MLEKLYFLLFPWYNNIIEFLRIVTANWFQEKLRGWDNLPPPHFGTIKATE